MRWFWHAAPLVLTLGSLSAWAQSTTGSTVSIFPLFVDGAAGNARYQSTLKIRSLAAKPQQCTLIQRNTSSPFVGVDGNMYSADVFDGGFSPPARTDIILDQFLPWEILRTTGQARLTAGYASLSCQGAVGDIAAQLQLSLTDAQNHKLGETTLTPASEGSSFQFLIDRREGTRFAFSLTNDSVAVGQFILIARDRFNYEVDRAYDTIESWSQVSRFADEMLALPADFVGTLELIGVSGGRNYAVGLQFTGSVFTAIPPLILSGASH